jgi:RNA polymerase sigma factor (sigma-70 family)
MRREQVSDQALIRGFISGNQGSLEVLLNRHQQKIFTAIYMIVQDTYIAEDLFQETFIKIIKTFKSGKYNEEGKFLPWATRIGRNMAIDYFRKAKRIRKVSSSDENDVFRTIETSENNREEDIIAKQKSEVIRELIKLLPEEQREVLVLRHYGELSFKEIAEVTNVSINTALGRMRYALNNMRKILEEKSISLQ